MGDREQEIREENIMYVRPDQDPQDQKPESGHDQGVEVDLDVQLLKQQQRSALTAFSENDVDGSLDEDGTASGAGVNDTRKSFRVPFIDDNDELSLQGIPLETKIITPEEYAYFASTLDILPFASIGLYNRMKARGEDVRIYGGFVDGQLEAAMICRITPAWKVFRWMEAPFGHIARNPLDSGLLVQMIQGIEELEDSDTLLYLRLESFLEYQLHDKDGNILDSWNHKAWRDELVHYKMQAMPLHTGFEPGRQARFSGLIELAEDHTLYQGVPLPRVYMEDLRAVLMKTRQELLSAMSDSTREKIEQMAKPYIQVRLLAGSELDQVNELKQGSFEREELDLSYLDAYQGESAMVLVTLEVQPYIEDFMEQYEAVSAELQDAFEAARTSPRNAMKQKALFAAMEKMKAWDRKLKKVETLKASGRTTVPLAAGLYLFNAGETLCLWSARHPDYPELHGLEAMHWFMLDWSRSRHALRYTFWGLSGNTHPGEEGYAAYAFARDFGARLCEYSGAFVAAFKPGSTRTYQAYLKSRNLQ